MANMNISESNLTLLREYKQEAYGYLADAEQANERFKEVLEAAVDKTGLEKKVISQFFKLSYKAKVGEYLEQADLIRVFNGE